MISLCDLPFSELNPYLDKYGSYLLGFAKQWGQDNGFNSIWYCPRNSIALSRIWNFFKKNLNNNDRKLLPLFCYIMSYVKFDEGKLLTKKKEYANYRFSDEREVRKCPDVGNGSFILTEERYKQYKEQNNGSLLNIGEDFLYSDINYIIVKNHRDIISVERSLEELKKKEFVFITEAYEEDLVDGKKDNWRDIELIYIR